MLSNQPSQLSTQLLPVSDNHWEEAATAAEIIIVNIKEAKNKGTTLDLRTLQTLIYPFIELATSLSTEEIQKADLLTNAQAVVEFAGTLFSSFLWISTMIDDTFDPAAKTPLSMFSWWGVGVGIGIGFLLSSAEMVCHKIINIVNQTNTTTILQAPTQNTRLTIPQKIALGIESVSHVISIGGRFAIASRFIPSAYSWIKIPLHVGSAIAGIIGSGAETRTHYNSMLRYNSMFKPKQKQEAHNTDDQYAYRPLNGNEHGHAVNGM